jgi:hypothetical protein
MIFKKNGSNKKRYRKYLSIQRHQKQHIKFSWDYPFKYFTVQSTKINVRGDLLHIVWLAHLLTELNIHVHKKEVASFIYNKLHLFVPFFVLETRYSLQLRTMNSIRVIFDNLVSFDYDLSVKQCRKITFLLAMAHWKITN